MLHYIFAYFITNLHLAAVVQWDIWLRFARQNCCVFCFATQYETLGALGGNSVKLQKILQDTAANLPH